MGRTALDVLGKVPVTGSGLRPVMRSVYRLACAIVRIGRAPDRRNRRQKLPQSKRLGPHYFTVSNSAFACAWQNGGS